MDYFNHHTIDLLNHSIKITVYLNGVQSSRVLGKREILTIMGYKGIVYSDETSLFCDACRAFRLVGEEELLEFLDYTEEDWDNLWDFVECSYYNPPLITVDCRKN